jgi:hypothetical protein
MKRPAARIIVVAGACVALSACAAAPRQKPLPTTRITPGAETVETARRQLEGRWTLISLDVVAEDGRSANVQADGDLSLDEFGNLQIEYRLSDAGQAALEQLGIHYPNAKISTAGRAVIDAREHRITYMPPDAGSRPFDPELSAKRANPFTLERVRFYALDDSGLLTLTTRHDNGQDAAKSRWKR